jgi:hypothetical protein
MTPPANSCATCKWARFTDMHIDGDCDWPIPVIVFASSVIIDSPPGKYNIWPTDTGCPTWEGKTE